VIRSDSGYRRQTKRKLRLQVKTHRIGQVLSVGGGMKTDFVWFEP